MRYLPQGKENDERDIKLLGRCSPPPHDRFIGLTGRIECELEAVTPIFISDSEFVKEDKDNPEHKSYRFFRLINENEEKEFAIPSTSLRGMLRSVFEAATNSCFSVFEGEKRLSYREVQKARAMKPAIVRSLPGDKSIGRIEICESARVPFNLLKEDNWKCGEDAYAIFSSGKVNQITKKHLNGGKKGWVKITGKNIPNKRNEYFFYPTENQLNFDEDRTSDYNKVLEEQIANEFPTEYQTPTLEVGNLVYAEVSQNEVVNIALVKVPRLLYRNSIGELLPDYLRPCIDYNNLCPACRVFGWVHQNPPKDEKKVAYAGRVKISHAKIIKNTGTIEVPLAILSTPKPTTNFFYLLKNEMPVFDVIYDTEGAQLRGRKFYRHQEEAKEQEYKQAGNEKGKQNRTIRDALNPGAKFNFTIRFENLSPVELGALLWSVEMEEGMHHKVGLAKPLGFGSVKLSIKKIEIFDHKERYNSFTNSIWKIANDEKKKQWLKQWLKLFKETMKNKYDNSFEELDNIKDIETILGAPPLSVHYPRTSEKPDVLGENFKWFMQNKRFGKKPLKIASEDTEGFPLNFSTTRRNKRRY